MKTEKITSAISTAKIVLLGLIIGAGLQLMYVYAWTGPSSSAPNGNVSGPITTSAVSQTKSGNLILGNDLAVSRNAVLGSYVSVSNTLGLCLNGVCKTTWPGGVSSVTGGSGITISNGTGDATITADTSYLQQRITGTCSGGQAMTGVNTDGSVNCSNPTVDPATLFGSMTSHSCNRFQSTSGNGTTYCTIGAKDMCFLTRTYGRDGDDVDGFGCTLTQSAGNWSMQAFGEDFDYVYCTAYCI